MSETVLHSPYVSGQDGVYGADAYGNEIGDFADAVALEGFGFDPGSTSEPRMPGHDRVIVEPTLYGPFDMPFKPKDRVIVRGVDYEIVGVVRQWRNYYSNREAGAVVSLRRVDG